MTRIRSHISAFFVLGIVWSDVFAGSMPDSQKVIRPKMIIAAGFCAGVVAYLAISSGRSASPNESESPLPESRDLVERPVEFRTASDFESDPATSMKAQVLKLFIESNERMAVESSISSEEIQGDWIRDLIFSKPFGYTDFWNHSTGNIFVEQFLDALQDRDPVRIKVFEEVLRLNNDWSAIDFFSGFEFTANESGLSRWEATIQLPNTEGVWRVTYEELSGSLLDPESKETTLRIYR